MEDNLSVFRMDEGPISGLRAYRMMIKFRGHGGREMTNSVLCIFISYCLWDIQMEVNTMQ